MARRSAALRRQPRTIGQAWLAIHPPRVLVATDDRTAGHTMVAGLKRAGFRVTESQTGRSLQQRLEQGHLRPGSPRAPDVVVCATRMAGFGGLDLLRALRRTNWTTPVILVSDRFDEITHAEAARLGATAIFEEPYDLEDLETVIANLLFLE